MNRPATRGDLRAVGDPHNRRPVECRAVRVGRRPVDRLIAYAACPGGVPASVPETSLMTQQDLVRAEGVPVRWGSVLAAGWSTPGRRLYQLPQHKSTLRPGKSILRCGVLAYAEEKEWSMPLPNAPCAGRVMKS